MGPLAATLAKEARRQNIHESAAAAHVRGLPHVAYFQKLKSARARRLCTLREMGKFLQVRPWAMLRVPQSR